MNNGFFDLLQINDSTFPIGAFSFSWGLETFVQQGKIFDSKSAFEYLKSELEESFIYSDLLLVRLAFENSDNEEKITELNEIFCASKTPFEIREGSRKLANRFQKTIEAIEHEELKISNGNLKNEDSISAFPIQYALYCKKRKIDKESALSAFLYSQMSARITNCVKLVPLSQSDGQKILYELIKIFPSVIEETEQLSEDDLCRSAIGIDIRAMQHEFLYTRLYSN